ncbi:MAG: hypothetical protein JST47_01000 [Bacteroidetes bacterium]|nr:hypothetical protein [Bacteroidota bacterium]
MENDVTNIDAIRFGYIVSILVAMLIVSIHFQQIKNAIVYMLMQLYAFFIQHHRL